MMVFFEINFETVSTDIDKYVKCDLDDLYGEVDVFIWLYWFLHLTFICIDDIYDKY